MSTDELPMNNLIEALTIFSKYMSEKGLQYPTHCEHDILCIMGVESEETITGPDAARLKHLGFLWLEDAAGEPGWASFRFGSA